MKGPGFDVDFFMKEALKQAHQAYNEGEVPVGAVVVCNEQIIAKSYNMTEKLQDVTAHAEILAITSASQYLGSKYLTDCTIYVTLEPCIMCAGAIHWGQLHKIVYGANDEKRGYTNYSEKILHNKTKVVAGIRKEECGELMTKFFKDKR